MQSRIGRISALLKDSPRDEFLRHALALEYQKSGELDEARKVFESLLHDSPGYIGSYYHLGKLLEHQNENEGAKEWYLKGMELAKANDDRHTYNELKAAYEDIS